MTNKELARIGHVLNCKGTGKPGVCATGKRNKKETIQSATRKLADKGYELVGVAPFDMKAMSARYDIKFPDGKVRTLYPSQIHSLVK